MLVPLLTCQNPPTLQPIFFFCISFIKNNSHSRLFLHLPNHLWTFRSVNLFFFFFILLARNSRKLRNVLRSELLPTIAPRVTCNFNLILNLSCRNVKWMPFKHLFKYVINYLDWVWDIEPYSVIFPRASLIPNHILCFVLKKFVHTAMRWTPLASVWHDTQINSWTLSAYS